MLFEFQNVSKSYGIQKIFKNLNFSLERGTFSILTGSSGAGKSTLFRMLCGIEKPNEGEIIFLGRRLDQHSASHLRHLGLIFQNPRGMMDKTVLENVTLPLKLDGVSKNAREKRGLEWLDNLGLRKRVRSLYRELSGGEVQKAEFARALIRKPRLILADEPTAHLDAVQADLLLDILWDHYQDGATVFIATHHPPTFSHPSILRYHVGGLTIRRLNESSPELSGIYDPARDIADAVLET